MALWPDLHCITCKQYLADHELIFYLLDVRQTSDILNTIRIVLSKDYFGIEPYYKLWIFPASTLDMPFLTRSVGIISGTYYKTKLLIIINNINKALSLHHSRCVRRWHDLLFHVDDDRFGKFFKSLFIKFFIADCC